MGVGLEDMPHYRALGGTPYRWLDVGKPARLLLSKHHLNRIRYPSIARRSIGDRLRREV